MITEEKIKVGLKVYYIKSLDEYTVVHISKSYVVLANSAGSKWERRLAMINSDYMFRTEKEAAIATIALMKQDITAIEKIYLRMGSK